MIGWYRSQIAQHGVVPATKLFFRSYSSRVVTILANKTLPPKFACPCCGWKGRRFAYYIGYDSKSAEAECPQCNSHARHRALYFWLKNDFQLSEKSGTVLICAPEKALEPLWQSAAQIRFIKSDIEPSRQVDVLADLQQLPFDTNSLNIIWCHHILEQIKDDRAALNELYRVLKPITGQLIISSSMTNEDSTFEFGYSDSKRYGNWRAYGKDYPDRLAQSGFTVQPVDYKFSEQECLLYQINAREKVYICSKN